MPIKTKYQTSSEGRGEFSAKTVPTVPCIQNFYSGTVASKCIYGTIEYIYINFNQILYF